MCYDVQNRANSNIKLRDLSTTEALYLRSLVMSEHVSSESSLGLGSSIEDKQLTSPIYFSLFDQTYLIFIEV